MGKKKDEVDATYTNRLIGVKTCRTITHFDLEKIFEEDFANKILIL